MNYLLLRLKRFCGFVTGFVFFIGGILKLMDPVGAGPGNPYALFFIVTENYDVSLDVDPAYSRIDQVFVLRKCTRKSMDANWKNVSADVLCY